MYKFLLMAFINITNNLQISLIDMHNNIYNGIDWHVRDYGKGRFALMKKLKFLFHKLLDTL